MPLLQFFQRLRPGASPSVQAAQPPSAAEVEQARTRARRRMVGMAVLVGAGVIGFSWLFETQPRPLPADVQVVSLATARSTVPARDGAPWSGTGGEAGGVALPAPVRRAQEAQDSRELEPQEEQVADLPTPQAPRIPQPAAPRVPEVTARPPAAPGERDAAPRAAPTTRPTAPASAAAPTPPRPAASRPEAGRTGREDTARGASAPATGGNATQAAARRASDTQATIDGFADTRFIVQVGAFSDVASARAARLKVERLGIKTYTQAVDTPGGRKIRVRVGPYVNKADADRAMAALKKAGMGGALLTL